MPNVRALDAQSLCQRCDPGEFSFRTTAELDTEREIVGRARAAVAVPIGQFLAVTGSVNRFGLVPEGSVNYLVAEPLTEMSAVRRAFAEAGRQPDDDERDNTRSAGSEEEANHDD